MTRTTAHFRLFALLAIVALAASPLMAGETFLEEPFNYASGQNLSGLNGGIPHTGSSFDSPWSDGGNLLTQNGSVVNQLTGNQLSTRNFTLNNMSGDDVWFSANLATTDLSSLIGFGFPQIGGLGNNGSEIRINGSNFEAQFPGATTATTGGVAANTPYNMVGKIDFNQSGLLDQLTVWINPTTLADITGNPTGNLQTTSAIDGDFGNPIVGSVMQIRTNSASPFTVGLDDIRIGSHPKSVTGGRFDLDQTAVGSDTEAGFRKFNAGASLVFAATDAEHGYGNFTATVTDGLGNNPTVVDNASPGGVAATLKKDGVTDADDLQLSFTDLKPGSYTLKTFHHQLQVGDATSIELRDASDNSLLATLDTSSGSDLVANASVRIMTDGNGDFALNIIGVGGDAVLNGFEIVPEPTSYAMALFGLVSMAGFGYWGVRRKQLEDKAACEQENG